jgi:hypothetical protein
MGNPLGPSLLKFTMQTKVHVSATKRRRTAILNGFRRQPKGAKASIFTYSYLLPRIRAGENVVRAEGLEPSWAV